jgi:hypothetical protein
MKDLGPGKVFLKDLIKWIVGSPKDSKKQFILMFSSRIREKRLRKYSGFLGKGSKQM